MQPPLSQMEKTTYCSLKLLNVCDEIQSVITTLKQIEDRLDLNNYIKMHETIQKLEEHKKYIWQIYNDINVSE
jgi:hypothetical protein